MALAPSSLLFGVASRVDHDLVDEPLFAGLDALDLTGDAVLDRGHGLQHTLAQVAIPAVTALGGLERPRARAAGNRRAAQRAVLRATSTSTVGFPRESRISRAMTATISATVPPQVG